MCVYMAIIATILAVMLWCMDKAAALKCSGYKLNLGWQNTKEKGNVHQREKLIFERKG